MPLADPTNAMPLFLILSLLSALALALALPLLLTPPPPPLPSPRLLLLPALPPQLPACAYDPSLYLTLPCNCFHVSCIANLPSPFALTTRLLVSRGSVTVSQHKG